MFKKKGEPRNQVGFFAKHKLLVAITMLVGTIVGAGILAIPYVIAKAGFLYGILMIIGLGLALMMLNLFMGEVVLRTKEQHQLTGYAEKYLGKWGKILMVFAMFFLGYGALIAYLIGEGQTLFHIFKFGTPLMYSIIFFLVTSFIIFRGVKATGKAELVLISLLFLIIFLVGVFSFDGINITHFTKANWAYFFLPYGVIFFALHGSPTIPVLQEELGKEKKKMKKVIIIGTLIPVALYIIFSFFIVGLVGLENFELLQPNERIATIALSIYSSHVLGLLANIVAVLAMFTSYLTLGIALQEVYEYDYKLSRKWSLSLTFSIPLVMVILNISSFIVVIGVTGAIAGGLDGILIMLMYWKAKTMGNRKPEYSLGKNYLIGCVIIFLFSIGILFQLWTNFLK